MRFLSRFKKPSGREQVLQLLEKITQCPHYASQIPGQIWCKAKKQFVTIQTCKECRREQ